MITVRKGSHCRIKCFILSMILAFMVPVQDPESVYARFTEVGKPGTKSYVSKKSRLPVILFVGDSRAMMCTYPGGNQPARKNYLKKEFRPKGIYIDTYSCLMKSGLVTGSALGMRDDYHYNWSTGEKILTKIRKSVTASLRKARKKTKTKAESKAA